MEKCKIYSRFFLVIVTFPVLGFILHIYRKRIHTIEEVVKSQPKQEPKKKWLFF